MIVDKLLSPVIKGALSAVGSSAATLGEVLDFGERRNNGMLAQSDACGWVVTIAGATSAGAATLNLSLITSAQANLASPKTLWTGAAVPLADVAGKGKQFFIPVPVTDDWEQFVAFRANYGTAAYTGGTISIEFAANKRNWRAYPAVNNR